MSKRIAIVEDDPDQRANYADAITKKGYKVNAYGSRDEALEGIEEEMPDLAILDIILGEEVDAGFQLCRDLLARAPTLPVIFLTERIDEIDKISGLRLGAWDYLPKPISAGLSGGTHILIAAESTRCARKTKKLTARPQRKLATLPWIRTRCWPPGKASASTSPARNSACWQSSCACRAMRSATKSLMNATMQSLVTNNTINTHMRNIRKKFEKADPEFSAIKSEYGFGYRWSVD